MFRFKTVFFLFFMLMCQYQARGQLILTWQSLTTRYNPAYISHFEGNITQPHNLSYNMEVGLLVGLPCETIITLDIKAPQPGKSTLISLLKFKYMLRDIIQGVRNNFFKIVNESLAKFSNLPKKCPTRPNFLWYLHNCTVPIEQFPITVTELNFLTDFKITHPNNDFILQSTFKGRVECKKRKGFGCGNYMRRG